MWAGTRPGAQGGLIFAFALSSLKRLSAWLCGLRFLLRFIIRLQSRHFCATSASPSYSPKIAVNGEALRPRLLGEQGAGASIGVARTTQLPTVSKFLVGCFRRKGPRDRGRQCRDGLRSCAAQRNRSSECRGRQARSGTGAVGQIDTDAGGHPSTTRGKRFLIKTKADRWRNSCGRYRRALRERHWRMARH